MTIDRTIKLPLNQGWITWEPRVEAYRWYCAKGWVRYIVRGDVYPAEPFR